MHTISRLIWAGLQPRLHIASRLTLLAVLLVLPLYTQAQAASAEAAAQMALAQFGEQAKVLSVREKTDEQGAAYFEVQVISDGNVRIVRFSKI